MNSGSWGRTTGFDGTAGDAIKASEGFSTFESGSKELDGLLEGGYREGRVYEVYGKSGSGKTQLAMQAVLLAARSGEKALFVDTEGSFRPERLEGIAKKRGWDTSGILERIEYVRSNTPAEQMELVQSMSRRRTTSECRLVAIDTFTRAFSLEMPGRSSMSERQAALDVHLSQVARDAFINARAYLLTNRVTFGAVKDVGIGGKTVEQLVHASVRLEREGPEIVATATPPGRTAVLRLGEGGVE
jgi:RecA/RadA recombinase